MSSENKTVTELQEEINSLKAEVKKLKQENITDKYKRFFDEIRLAIYETSPEGELIDINPYGVKMLGYSTKEEILKSDIINQIYSNPGDRQKFLERVERVGFVKNFEIKIKRKDGKHLVTSDTSFVNRDEDGNSISFFGVLKDITQSKDVEEQLKEYVEKLAVLNRKLVKSETELKKINASKDKFFSIIAHDLRAPFTSLLGLTDFLTYDIDNLSKEEVKVFAQKINISSKGIYELVENLLEWARVQTATMEYNPHTFDLYSLGGTIITTMVGVSVKKNITIENNISKETNIYADKNTITSVFQNLIANALKFTKPGGTISVDAKLNNKYYLISVKDNGVGIAADIVEKLFKIDEHHTTCGTANEKGTGLGLILCKELVEMNGGKIWVESEIDKGSTFYFTVPTEKTTECS